MKQAFLLSLLLVFSQTFQAQQYRLLVGTYTNSSKSQGIYSYELDMKTGTSVQKSVATGVSNPSYLCLSPDKKFVYSVNESELGSAANAFSFEAATGKLTLLNRSLTQGKGPCYISCTPRHVFTANYGGGSLSIFGLKADGSLTELQQKIQRKGSSANVERQSEAHVHQVVVSKDNRFVYANDLGTDHVTVYAYHPTATREVLTPWDTLAVKPGSGPRHLTFSKNGKNAYLVQELIGGISVLDCAKGRLTLKQETSLLIHPNQKAWAADIHLSPDEKFLYATNRSPANNITCFSVDREGLLTFCSQVPTLGDGPRNFAITPDGKFLLVAHQFTDNIVVFSRNEKTGALTDTGKRIDVGAPVCVVFY